MVCNGGFTCWPSFDDGERNFPSPGELGADFATFIRRAQQVSGKLSIRARIPTTAQHALEAAGRSCGKELRCLVGEPFFLPLHCLAPTGIAPAA